MSAALLAAAVANGGFLSFHDLAALAQDDKTRLQPILVRCGGCRFTAPAQDVNILIGYVENAADHVRDISLPANDPAFARYPKRDLRPRPMTRFNEADCGGVFDGNSVVSDADGGL